MNYTSRTLLAISSVALLAVVSVAIADDSGIRRHTAAKSEAVIRNDLRMLGLPQGTIREQGRVARITLRVQGQTAELEMDRFDGGIRIIDAPPEARQFLETRIPVPGIRALESNARPADVQGVGPPCRARVQGLVAWNDAGSTDWPANLLDTLCSGAADSDQPGQCYERVMRGGLNWGGGTTWQPANAANLCKGSHDANATVACFEKEIGSGTGWQAAIDRCNR